MSSRTIIQRGRWLYDGTVQKPVTIIALDYDFWYEIGRADGESADAEVPMLNTGGLIYYVCLKSDPTEHPGWVDSQGFEDIAAARTWAECQVPTPIEWEPPETSATQTP